ncbi:MAG TPA: CBS domain-containing protein [Gaiellaceae bacterium]|nr:CBS domain-containing protein [Gaiellaceae bacterium]
MSDLRGLPLVNSSVPESATFGEAVTRLFEAQVPAIAVLGSGERVLGVLSELDVLRAVFPSYLGELRQTAFLEDDSTGLEERARAVRSRRVSDFVRRVELLDGDDSETHAAERFLHTGEQALPVLEAERFIGMLSVAALCHARLDRAGLGD